MPNPALDAGSRPTSGRLTAAGIPGGFSCASGDVEERPSLRIPIRSPLP